MDFKKARVITEEAVRRNIKLAGQCGCACEQEVVLHGQCSDCACDVY
jgi:hypothetical protein